jgi:hypothetical protein
MPENTGKKKFIKDFLVSVKAGEALIEDIFIDRIITPPGVTTDELPESQSTANSLSGRSVSTIIELLKDDLRYTFEDGFFTFRIVSAFMGSGKTSLIEYLHELIKTEATYKNLYVISQFPLTDVLSIGVSQKFIVQLPCYMLAETFYGLLHSEKSSVKDKTKKILKDYLENKNDEFNQLISISDSKDDDESCRRTFINYFSNSLIHKSNLFEDFFLQVISEISKVEPQYTFVYLIDEFDGLEKVPDEMHQTSIVIRSLVKKVLRKFKSKINLLIYFLGTSANIKHFILNDPVIYSLINNQVINLDGGNNEQLRKISEKICGIIEGAFGGYKDFGKAWQEIQEVPIYPGTAEHLRQFCKRYSMELLKIYEKYFNEEPEQKFEGNARELVEAQCRQKWEKYLTQKSYSLISATTTTHMARHAFDCYVELVHNGHAVARCFGEAKNYDLLKDHLETFEGWLKDVNFNPEKAPPEPPDLAFMIAPGCAPLLRRKLELKHIGFIQRDKIVSPPDSQKRANHATNINTAQKEEIIQAFKGTGIRTQKVDKLLDHRKVSKPFKNIDDLVSALKLTQNAKEKLQKKLDDGKICFSDS